MKEYVGKPDPKYGGIVTNVCELPIGTSFYVYNGAWIGTIKCDFQGLYVHIDGCLPKRFKFGDEEYLAIKIIEEADEPEEIVEKINECSVCKNNNSSKCKNCEITKNTIIPSNFLADVSKITPFFVDSYYELLYKYTQLLKKSKINYTLNEFDIGD